MAEITRLQQRGENIYYTPLSEEKHHILIDDMTAGSLDKLQKEGFTPAVILESSPGNFQCLLTIPKLHTGFDRDVGNRLTERLNRLYGDKKLSGCIHPHRAPGFENRKPKHRQEDGGYPQVRLLYAERRECSKALELARQIDREYAEAAAMQRERPRAVSTGRPGDPVTAYYAHLENIRKHLTIDDYSRVDAMIALRMRSNGHSQLDVAEAIRNCAPTIREGQAGRNWERYAERTANYAFGVAGDVDLVKNDRYREMWRRVEGMGESNPQHTPMRMR
jgi:plasmid and phage DNA primase